MNASCPEGKEAFHDEETTEEALPPKARSHGSRVAHQSNILVERPWTGLPFIPSPGGPL